MLESLQCSVAQSPLMSKAPTPPTSGSSGSTFANSVAQIRYGEYHALLENARSIAGLSVGIESKAIVLTAAGENGEELARKAYVANTETLKLIRRCSTWCDNITAVQFIDLVDRSINQSINQSLTPLSPHQS